MSNTPPTEPKVTVRGISLKDVAALLIKEHNIKEGHHELAITFSIGIGAMSPDGVNIYPSAFTSVAGFELHERDAPTQQSVDASTLWPKKKANSARAKKTAG